MQDDRQSLRRMQEGRQRLRQEGGPGPPQGREGPPPLLRRHPLVPPRQPRRESHLLIRLAKGSLNLGGYAGLSWDEGPE